MLGPIAQKAPLRRDSSAAPRAFAKCFGKTYGKPCDFSQGFFSSGTCGVDGSRSSWSTVGMNESRLGHSSLRIGSAVWGLLAAAAVALIATAAHAAIVVPDGLYKVQCGDSVYDGGQLGANGVLAVNAGHASGTLRFELSISGDEMDAPAAEQHTLPSITVEGAAGWSESAFTPIDGRPQRLIFDLTATNWSLKDRLGTFALVNNNAPDGGDDETSSLSFDRQVYNGVCKIEKK
ncbi:hypothetical protein BH10BDE1_BH10BDE1_18540 [soil metagenome]